MSGLASRVLCGFVVVALALVLVALGSTAAVAEEGNQTEQIHSETAPDVDSLDEIAIPDRSDSAGDLPEYEYPDEFDGSPWSDGPTPESSHYPSGILPEPDPGDDRVEFEPDGFFPGAPSSTVVRLEVDGTGVCSGAMITEYHVLTAGHCIYGDGEWANQVEVYPGLYHDDVRVEPYHKAYPEVMRIHPDWAGDEDPHHDFALLTLDRNIGQYTGYMGLEVGGTFGGDDFYEWGMNAYGYPVWAEDASQPPDSQMTGLGPTTGTEGGFYNYFHTLEIDLTGGQSGGPVFHQVDADVGMIASVIAYADDSDYEEREHNWGVRIGPGKNDLLNDWVGDDDPPSDETELVDTAELGYWDDTVGLSETELVQGETLTLWNEVRNLGTADSGTYQVEYYLSDDWSCSPSSDHEVASDWLSTSALGFSYAEASGTVDAASGEYQAYRYIDHDSAFGCEFYDTTVEVLEPPEFDVEITETGISSGWVLMDYEVENVGDAAGERTITVEYDGNQECAGSFELDGGDSESAICDYNIEQGDAPGVSITVSSPDGHEDSTTVSIDAAEFEVGITDIDDPVVGGEDLDVSVNVENSGDEPDSQTVDLYSDDGSQHCDGTSVSLDGGATSSEELTCATESGDAPGFTVVVESDDDSDSAPATVDEPAEFLLDIHDASVSDGSIEVSYTVENVGDVSDSQDVTLSIDGSTEGTSPHSLGPGEGASGSFEYTIGSGDAPDVDVEVCSEDDCESTSLDVDPADLALAIGDTNAPVVEGDELVVSALVENTGDEPAPEDIELAEFDGIVVDSEPVDLDAGETETVDLEWDTDVGDAGTGEVAVDSATGDEQTVIVTVLEPAEFAVAIDSIDDPILEGDQLDVDATVENLGEASDQQTVELRIDGDSQDSETVDLDGGTSESVSLAYESELGDAPELAVEVASEDDTESTAVEVLAVPTFEVTLTDTTVDSGSLTVDYQVENTGDVQGTQDIDFAVDSESVTTHENVTLDAGETHADSFTYDIEAGDAPEITTTVGSETDEDATTVSLDPAALTVTIDGTNDPARTDGFVLVNATVGNDGDVPGEDTVTLTLESGDTGIDADAADVTIDPGESEPVAFVYEPSPADAGNYTATVSTADDSDQQPIQIQLEPLFAVSPVELPEEVVSGNALDVTVDIHNEGGLAGTQNITLSVDDAVVDTIPVTLEEGESVTETLTYEPTEDDIPEIDIAVESDDDAVGTSVIVLEPPTFAVDIVSTTEPVAGDALVVEFVAENTGDVGDSQTVDLTTEPDIGTNATALELDSGESATRELTVQTGADDAGEYTVTIASADENTSETATVLEPAGAELWGLDIAGAGEDATVLGTADGDITANVTNVGDIEGAFDLTLTVTDADGDTHHEATAAVTLGSGESSSVLFEDAVEQVEHGHYDVTLTADGETTAGSLTVSVDVNGDGAPATDTTGDGLLNDVDGDGEFTIFDVQTLFNNFDGVQNAVELFDFNGDDQVAIFDVQALFNELATAS